MYFKGFALCDNKNIFPILNCVLICHVLRHNMINKFVTMGVKTIMAIRISRILIHC